MYKFIKESKSRRGIAVPFVAILILIISCNFLSSDNKDTGDWPTSSPQMQGLEMPILMALDAKLNSGDYGEVHSLLIVRNGYIVFEKYYRGYNADRKHRLYSVTKSFASTLIGLAHEQGKIGALDTKILDFFPEYDVYKNMNADKQAITLDNVLTMQMGTHWDEFTYDFGDPRNSIYQIRASEDWIKYVLDQPMVESPGTRFRYNTGGSMVLSGVIRNQVGQQAREFADEYLFEPLGIDDYDWETGAQGLTNTGWGLWMRPRDMARFGQMYLQGGLWKGEQVVSEDWVRNATANHADAYQQYYYGYQWWLAPMDNFPGHVASPDDIKIAMGYGDQYIFVIPDLNMVVVSTAGNYAGQGVICALDFVPEYVIGAAVGRIMPPLSYPFFPRVN